MSTSLDHRRTANTAEAVDWFQLGYQHGCDHRNLNARWDANYGSYAECEDCGHRENPEGAEL
jgi:hypothetical protein